MHKHKSHKGLLKRIKVSGRGKIRRRKTGTGHLLSHKSGNKKQHLRGAAYAKSGDIKRLEKMMHRPLKAIDAGDTQNRRDSDSSGGSNG